MKNNNYKEINFFDPKIDINIDENEVFVRRNLLKLSFKIYVLVFFIAIIYLLFNRVKINIKYNLVEKNINKISQSSNTINNLNKIIEEQKMLNELFNGYEETNKISSTILEEIEKIKFKEVDIEDISWSLNNIELNCYGKSEKDAIIFASNLRKNDKFKDIIYNGGTSSATDVNFKFKINIII